ncbi:MAG: c-type cytochrome [Gemmatimonadales bacterium]
MNVILRRIAMAAGALVALAVVAACAVYFMSERHVTRRYALVTETIPLPTDSASLARGRHLARAIAKCADCHTETFGGHVLMDNPAMGRIVSLNLTRGKGGLGTTLTDADWVRAIRHGVGHDGRALRIMPARDFRDLSAADLGEIIAYAKSVPPVDNELPPNTLGPVSRALIATNQFPLFDAETSDFASHAPATAPPVGPTAEYGSYLVHTAGCTGCHGPTLSGGKIPVGDPSWPPAANLTPSGLTAYDQAAFTTLLRTGMRPGGTKIRSPMPIEWTKEMTDDEITALWLYLKTVRPKDFGGR